MMCDEMRKVFELKIAPNYKPPLVMKKLCERLTTAHLIFIKTS